MLLVVYYFYVLFGHSGEFPLRRFGTQFTYGVVKAFYNPSGAIGPPRIVEFHVSLLGPQTLLALLPLVWLNSRVNLPMRPHE